MANSNLLVKCGEIPSNSCSSCIRMQGRKSELQYNHGLITTAFTPPHLDVDCIFSFTQMTGDKQGIAKQ